jgi:adenine-specific DNA-methyltransferase
MGRFNFTEFYRWVEGIEREYIDNRPKDEDPCVETSAVWDGVLASRDLVLQLMSGLHWFDREQAMGEIEQKTELILQPVEAESINFRATANQIIEGDNLASLKILLETYRNSVDVIYIDPPYNTGQISIYTDNFRRSQHSFKAKSNSYNELDIAHGLWLSMLYPRLAIAREFLALDGVIFISIDDREIHNLRHLMDEIFGAQNFVATVVWRKKVVRGRGAKHIIPQTEYVLIYAKDIKHLKPFSEPLTEQMLQQYNRCDENGPYKLIALAKTGTAHSARPNLVYSILAPDGSLIECPTHQWRWSRETLEKNLDRLVFKQGRDQRWRVYTKQYLYIDRKIRYRTPISYYDRYTTSDGTSDLKAWFGDAIFDFPKPVGLIKDLLTWIDDPHSPSQRLVMDFFAGSGTTAEAVLRLNHQDGGNRRFILIQIPENTSPKTAAYHKGFTNIADICKERVRRVISHLQQQTTVPPPSNAHHPTDLGFRVLKLQSPESKAKLPVL